MTSCCPNVKTTILNVRMSSIQQENDFLFANKSELQQLNYMIILGRTTSTLKGR